MQLKLAPKERRGWHHQKNIALLISNKQKKSRGSSSNITYLAAATHDNDTDSIVDQDDDVVLADVPNHSFLSLQKLQGDVLDDDLDDDNNNNDNDNNDNDNNFGVEYNTTVYDGRETLLQQSICPDYQPVLALQMLVQVLLLVFPLFLGMD